MDMMDMMDKERLKALRNRANELSELIKKTKDVFAISLEVDSDLFEGNKLTSFEVNRLEEGLKMIILNGGCRNKEGYFELSVYFPGDVEIR